MADLATLLRKWRENQLNQATNDKAIDQDVALISDVLQKMKQLDDEQVLFRSYNFLPKH